MHPAPSSPRQPTPRYLPPPGFERTAFLLLAALVLALRLVAIFLHHLDSDEAQHAHVVWGWATGHLQYRDIFDNHMPLFQMAYAPLMAILGERPDILIFLRFAVLPFYFVSLWCIFKLTAHLYSKRAAPWVCLIAAAMPQFLFASTEFRPDILWAAFWLLALLVAVTGNFTIPRAFAFGLILGLAFAVSLKTAELLVALLAATLLAFALAWLRRAGPSLASSLARLAAIAVGAAIPPAAFAFYFYSRGAFWIMVYCVLTHNTALGLRRWHIYSFYQWCFPLSLLILGFCGWLIFRQTSDTRLAIRRAIILLTPWFYLSFLLRFCPDITHEDDLPYIPLTPLLAFPLLAWFQAHWTFPRIEAAYFSRVLPALCLALVICVSILSYTRRSHIGDTTDTIQDVLSLTGPNDMVMDAKGDSIFRMRPYYWVFETITYHKIRAGLFQTRVPEALENTDTTLCYVNAVRHLIEPTRFIVSNYILFDPRAPSLAVAGKELGSPPTDGNYTFDVAIPATYAVVSESGATAGQLDGSPYLGPVQLSAGHHQFRRTSGSGRAAIFLGRALAQGFHPLFDASEKMAELKWMTKQLDEE